MSTVPQSVFPHSVETERAVLGSILLDNAALNVALETIQTEDFFSERHRMIFSAMVDLANEKSAADLVTVHSRLTDRGTITKVGEAAYLAALTDGLPVGTAASVTEYARIVKEKSNLRKIITACQGVIGRCLEAGEESSELLGVAVSMLVDLDSHTAEGRARSFQEAALSLMKKLEAGNRKSVV